MHSDERRKAIADVLRAADAPVSASALAEKFSVGETSLKNYFRGVYGQNISTYLREVRMKAAAEFLEDTSRPIAEIAEQIGYSNQGKFAAVFKKQFGMSPLEYRRAQKLATL